VDLGLKGKTALVTASSKGIGKQCALALAAEGANVVICARGGEQLEQTAHEVAAVAGADRVLAVAADLSRAEDIERLCHAARAKFGAIDVLVYIGGSPHRGGFQAVTEDHLRQAFDLTVMPAFRLLREVVPQMQERGWGRVVTVQSRAVREPIPDLFTSVATRPGVAGMFKYLANEVARDGVLVNVVVPGRIDTARFQKGAEQAAAGAEAYVQMKVADIPVRRLGQAKEIASAVCFLVSDQASYINGAALQVDGGVIRAI